MPEPPAAAPAAEPVRAEAVRPEPAKVEPGKVEVADAIRVRVRGHGVAVGMFADPANAARAEARLRDAGLPVLVDPVESSRGTLTRIRVGPLDDRAAADAAARQIRALGLDARVYGP